MAHYIAGLITFAKANPDDADAQRECARAVLELWEHRSTFPGPNSPLASFDPIIRGLQRLDPERATWGYVDRFRAGIQGDDTPTPATVDLALLLDQSLGGVIRFLVQEAVDEASSAESKWLDAGEATVVEDESIVSSIIQTMGYGAAGKDKMTSALESVEAVQTVLSNIADYLRVHATE